MPYCYPWRSGFSIKAERNQNPATLLPLWCKGILEDLPTPALQLVENCSVPKQVEWAKIQYSFTEEINWYRKISFFFVVHMIVMFPNPAISKLCNCHIMVIMVVMLCYVQGEKKSRKFGLCETTRLRYTADTWACVYINLPTWLHPKFHICSIILLIKP